MSTRTFRYTWLTCLLLGASLACSTAANIGNRYTESKETVQAIATQAQGVATLSGEFFATVQGVATQHPGLVETARSFAAEQGPQLLGTAEAFATEHPGLIETGQAIIQEQGATLISTAQAVATERPELMETAQALISGGLEADSLLPDIPSPALEQVEVLFSVRDALSFSTDLDFETMVQFYKTSMVAYGWEAVEINSVESDNMASLRYERQDRTASVTISYSSATGRTLVVIYLEDR